MLSIFKEFDTFPSSVKYGIVSMAAGWLGIYLFFYLFCWVDHGEAPTRLMFQLAGLGVLICFFMLRVKKWARAICLMGNGIILLFFLVMVWYFFRIGQGRYTALSLYILTCFAVSTCCLASRSTSRFFNVYNGVEDPGSAREEKKSPQPSPAAARNRKKRTAGSRARTGS